MDLAAVPLFAGLSGGDLKSMRKSMKEARHEPGAEVVHQGTTGAGFMVILEGEAEVKTQDGRTKTLKAGDYFGEMALLDEEGRSATVTAKTNLLVAGLSQWDFKPFLMRHPEICYRLLQAMSRRVREVEAT